MRVALISKGPADDINAWSGIPWHVKSALTDLGADVVDISPLRVPWLRARYVASRLAHHAGRSYRYELDAACIRSFAIETRAALANVDVDAAISMSVLAVGRWESPVPLAVWGDATHANLIDTYLEYSRLPRRHQVNAERAESAAMLKASVMVYASPWAAQSAITTYGADPSRILIAPFGANTEPGPDFNPVTAIASRDGRSCRLVWIGADWERKRGGFCVEVVRELRARGLPAQLEMAGARPQHPLPDFVHHRGFVDKRTTAGRAEFDAMLSAAHLLLLPSRAEAFGIAVAEANAYAVPCLASDVGGLPGAVADGRAGYLLPADASPADYAERILEIVGDATGYRALATGAREEFELRLNWRSSCASVLARVCR